MQLCISRRSQPRIFRREDPSLPTILPTIGYIVKDRMGAWGKGQGGAAPRSRKRIVALTLRSALNTGLKPVANGLPASRPSLQQRAMAILAMPAQGRDARGTYPVPALRSALQKTPTDAGAVCLRLRLVKSQSRIVPCQAMRKGRGGIRPGAEYLRAAALV